MKLKVYFGIAVRIILVFGTALAISFATPWLHQFFGDVKHTCTIKQELDYSHCLSNDCTRHDLFNDGYNWSASHYWFAGMMFLLFALSLANAIMGSIRLISDNYNLKDL